MMYSFLGFPGSSVVKNHQPMPEIQETQVQALGQEDPLEKGMAELPGESHGQRSLAGYSP